MRSAVFCAVAFAAIGAQAQTTWVFDNLEQIGGHPVTVLGRPRVIDSPIGKAVLFNGVDEALLIQVHPLAGASTFTWEAIFRPDGGPEEQRWFHLQERGSENRMLFEVRIIGNSWCLDAFEKSGSSDKALLDRTRLYPIGRWYHVAAVYDGREFRSYVNGKLDGSAVVHFDPQKAGETSVGVRINRKFFFKGAVHEARFTARALPVAEFLAIPR